MFDAIEDIPTKALLAEIARRQVMMRYLVWSDRDPNDSFEVEAQNANDAAWAALRELGWAVSGEPYDIDEDPE